jgi:hypothetical protein
MTQERIWVNKFTWFYVDAEDYLLARSFKWRWIRTKNGQLIPVTSYRDENGKIRTKTLTSIIYAKEKKEGLILRKWAYNDFRRRNRIHKGYPMAPSIPVPYEEIEKTATLEALKVPPKKIKARLTLDAGVRRFQPDPTSRLPPAMQYTIFLAQQAAARQNPPAAPSSTAPEPAPAQIQPNPFKKAA